MSFLKNLNKNGFKSFSERAIDNLQKKDLIEGRRINKVEKLATNKSSGITKFDDLSKAGYGNTDMGRREVQSGNDNYFKNNFINPNNKTKEIGESMFKNVDKKTKEILESIIIQEDLLNLVDRNRGKAGLLAGATAGVGLHKAYLNSGADSIGKFTGEKMFQLGQGVKKGIGDTVDGVKKGYNDHSQSMLANKLKDTNTPNVNDGSNDAGDSFNLV